jgi:7-keto-8-aminopelargonate synthetase-like enzyme
LRGKRSDICGRAKSLQDFGASAGLVVLTMIVARVRVDGVALSLNKAFSAAGGALAVPNREIATRIRRCGGPMLFSGPIQPPMLGAAVSSARLHLHEDFPKLQAVAKHEARDLHARARRYQAQSR